MLLKAEAINLALMYELPLLVIDVQRGGPSTGLPTKTEQSDLLMAMYGRNGESPIPIIAARGPGDCFYAAIEAARIAVESMTPVILLSDGYIANGAEPWPVPVSADRIPFRCSTNVVLPAPFGPSRATRSPRPIRKSTPKSAWWPSGYANASADTSNDGGRAAPADGSAVASAV